MDQIFLNTPTTHKLEVKEMVSQGRNKKENFCFPKKKKKRNSGPK